MMMSSAICLELIVLPALISKHVLLLWWQPTGTHMNGYGYCITLCMHYIVFVGNKISMSSNANIFPRYWSFVIPRTKTSDAELWCFLWFAICAWINGWANNREAGDLRHQRAHYDVILICCWHLQYFTVLLHTCTVFNHRDRVTHICVSSLVPVRRWASH